MEYPTISECPEFKVMMTGSTNTDNSEAQRIANEQVQDLAPASLLETQSKTSGPNWQDDFVSFETSHRNFDVWSLNHELQKRPNSCWIHLSHL